MSVFGARKPVARVRKSNLLVTLRETLRRLESEPEQTAQIAHLRQILGNRIAEMERESA